MNVSITTAALLALLYVGLSAWVVDRRRRASVSIGDGGDEVLMARMRAHANFSEYGPLFLILLFLAEQAMGSGGFVTAMAAAFLLGRLAHPLGMVRPAPNPFRALGMVATWIPMAALALALVVHLATS